MEIILLDRGEGKTLKLLERAANWNGYIVCHTKVEAYRIQKVARANGIEINFPLTFNEFLEKQYLGKEIKCFHIDNADILLQALTNVPIKTISMTEKGDKNLF
ncbi:MAG: hypothetical protein KAX49_03665 [Halanaerobiales bacterium]|nr:hypothetical protein [Halanaerobiales bacterium]